MSVAPRQQMGKYMDVTHPAHVRPSATSKPVIVGNRSMLSDPMINELAQQAAAHKNGDETQTDIAAIHSHEKVVEPPMVSQSVSAVPKSSDDTKAKPETRSTQNSTENSETSEVLSKLNIDEPSQTDPQKPTETPVEKNHISLSTTETPPATTAVLNTSVIDSSTEPDALTPEDEAVAHAEQLVADGTYFLPIGQAKHRGQRLLFGLCLIVVLSLLVIDALLDIGIISLSGIPHTTFFGN